MAYDFYWSNGDIVINDNGTVETVVDDKEIAQAVQNRLQTPLGLIQQLPGTGMEHTHLVGKNVDYDAIRADIKDCLKQDPRIGEVRSIQMSVKGRQLIVSLESSIVPSGLQVYLDLPKEEYEEDVD